jgi:Fic family protein
MSYDPRFEIKPQFLSLVVEIAHRNAWLNYLMTTHNLHSQDWLCTIQREATTKLAHFSTAIEGNTLSLEDVEDIEHHSGVKKDDSKQLLEVKNYLAALKWIQSNQKQKTLKESDLFHLHKLISKGLLGSDQEGHYKTKANRIVDYAGRTIYTPPSPQKTPKLMQDLIDWLNKASKEKLHPIILSAIAHHRLVSIHPFSDGNGRISRALGVWMLYAQGFDTHFVLALDEFFEKDRQLYYDKIQQARDLDDDLTFWITYVAECLFQTLEKTQTRIQDLLDQSKALPPLSIKQKECIKFIKRRGEVRSPDLQKGLDISRARVNQIIGPLVKEGIVVQLGLRRGTTYRVATKGII